MMRTSCEWRPKTTWLTVVAGAVLAAVVFSPFSNSGGQEAKPDKKAAVPDWAADVDAAIKVIEENKFREFLEKYGPVEILRDLRQEDRIDEAVSGISSHPQAKTRMLTLLKALRKGKPKFDKSRGLATFELEKFEADGNTPDEKLDPPTIDGEPSGLGNDLKQVLVEANRLLAAGEIQKFVEQMFPASELARLQDPELMADLVNQIKPAKTKETPDRNAPKLIDAFQADFTQLQSLKPEMTDDGQVALYTIAARDPRPARVIKFQKVGNHWRFFDDSPRVVTEMTRQAKLKPNSVKTTVQLELVGGNWRIVGLEQME